MKPIIALTLLFLAVGMLPANDLEFPLIQSFAYFPFTTTRALPRHAWSVDLSSAYSNIFAYDFDRTAISDMECFSTVVGVRHGFSATLTGEAYFRFSQINGGRLDHFIENFHEAFGLPVAGRDQFPRNQVNYSYFDRFSYTGNQAALSPLVVGVLKEFPLRGSCSLAARLALGIPLQTKPGFSNGKPFVTAGLAAGIHRRRFSLEASGYLSWFNKPGWLGERPCRTHMFFSEVKMTWGHLVTGMNFRTSPLRQGDLASTGCLAFIGARIGKRLELGVTEDFGAYDTSPDVGFYLRWNVFSSR